MAVTFTAAGSPAAPHRPTLRWAMADAPLPPPTAEDLASPGAAPRGPGRALAPVSVGIAAAVLTARRRGRHGQASSARLSLAASAAPCGVPLLGTNDAAQKRPAGVTAAAAGSTVMDIAPPEVDFLDEPDTPEQPKPSPKGHDQFNWKKAWYPVHVVDIMDPIRPHKTQLLGMNIVIWNDGKTIDGEKQIGEWHVMLDACPHRKAPLSEGRVEQDGSLLCSYHAWRFNGQGDCTDLPYSPEHLQDRHKCSCRAKCQVFPTRVEDDLLFVWPDWTDEGHKESALKDPPLIEELHDPELSKKWIKFPVNLRDLELGWDVFFENAMDPSHFLVAHHNITGNRYTDPKWFDMKNYRRLGTETGVAVRGIPGIFDFRPPCLVKNQQDGGVIFAIYNTPTMPGKCRHIGFLVLDTETIAGDSGVVDKDAVKLFTGPVPIWLQHLLTSFFLHQDAVLLHHQEQNFRDIGFLAQPESEKRFREITYTPNEVDLGSIQFRRWLKTRAGGGVPWACDPTLPPRLNTNEKIFDVWNSHTKHCKKCLEAYHNIEKLKTLSFGSAAAVALVAPEGPERIFVGALALATGAALHKLSELFVVYEFNHQDNN